MSNPNGKDNDKDEDEFASCGIFDGCVDFEVWVGGQFMGWLVVGKKIPCSCFGLSKRV